MDGEKSPVIWLAASPTFAEGMDTATDPRDISKGKFTLSKNGYAARSGALVKRPGFPKVTFSGAADASGGFAAPIRTMRRFKSDDGTVNSNIVWEGRNIWEIQDTGAIRALAYDGCIDLNSGIYDKFGAVSPFEICHAERYDGIYFTDGVSHNLCRIYQGTGRNASIVNFPAAAPTTGITCWLDASGSFGNDYTLEIVNPGTPNASLAVTLTGHDLSVSLATDASGVATSTNMDVRTAIHASEFYAVGSAGLVVEAYEVVCPVLAKQHFWGGADDGDLMIDFDSLAFGLRALAVNQSNGRLFGIDYDDPTAYRWSDIRDPSTWGAGNVAYAEDQLTGIISIGAVMVLLEEKRLIRIDGTDPATWNVTEATANGLGMPWAARGSLLEIEGVIAYLSKSGVTVYDGTRPRPISDVLKNSEDPTRNYVPVTPGMWTGAFIVEKGDHLIVAYDSDGTHAGCDRAVLYDFRSDTWMGPWHFPEVVTCASYEPTNSGNGGRLYFGCASGNILAEGTGFIDTAAYATTFRSKTFDCGRESIDKQVIEMRCSYHAAAETALTFSLFREDEATAVTTTTVTVPAGHGVISKRVPHIRGRDFYMEVTQNDDVYFEVTGLEFDYFFVRLR